MMIMTVCDMWYVTIVFLSECINQFSFLVFCVTSHWVFLWPILILSILIVNLFISVSYYTVSGFGVCTKVFCIRWQWTKIRKVDWKIVYKVDDGHCDESLSLPLLVCTACICVFVYSFFFLIFIISLKYILLSAWC